MARPPAAPPADPPPGEFLPGDDEMEAEEREQAMVGDLFTIQGPEFDSVHWSIWRHMTRAEMAEDPKGDPWLWVCDRDGELRGADLQASAGGGFFNLRGYVLRGDGTRRVFLKFNRFIRLAGARRDFNAPVTPSVTPQTGAVTSNATGLSRGERIMLKLMRQQSELLAKIASAPPPAAAPPNDMLQMITGLRALDELRGKQAAPVNPDREALNAMIEIFDKGREVGKDQGTTVVDNPRGTDYVAMAKELAPLAERLLTGIMSRRRAPGPTPGTVTVEPAPSNVADAPQNQLGIDDIRWIAVGDALTRSIAEGDEPDSFATYLERQLTSVQLAVAKGMSVDAVLEMLLRYEPESPVLKSDAARLFVTAVLAELNAVPESPAE